jgi:uncharacterized membrane protein YhhN
MAYLFLAIGLIVTIIFLTKRTARVTLNVAFLKAVASMCFILTGLFAFVGNENCKPIVGALVAAGAAWGMLGDIALDLKYVFKKYEKSYTNAGFISFLVGHLFYIGAMYFAFGFSKLSLIMGAVCSVLSFTFVMYCEPLLKVKFGEYKLITIFYMGVLGAVTGVAIGYAIESKYSLAQTLLNAGFMLFLASDCVLSDLYFSLDEKKRTKRASIIINHALYYSAQFCIGISLLFI